MVSLDLERVGMADRSQRLPGQPSEGEQARVAKARAVVNEIPVIEAYEPTGCLDTETGNVVSALLRKVNGDGPAKCSQ